MKQRIISALVLILLIVPIFVVGGDLFKVSILLIAMLGMKEYLDIKETKKEMPILVKLLSYLFIPLILFTVKIDDSLSLIIDFRVLASLFLTLLLLVVLYHKRETYSINDANYVFMGDMFLGIVMSLFIIYYGINKYLLIYLILITTMTDTFALFCGMLIGRHKLLEAVSPKKTWEGSFGGSIFGTFIAVCFYITVINPEVDLLLITSVTLLLTIVGQLGDLFFSAIKRYYDKKDFSNLIPGHGGVLDRLDSLIFVLLAYSFFLTVL